MSRSESKYYSVVVAATNAVVSCLALLHSDDYGFVVTLAVVSFGLFATLCLFEVGNILFLARTFILGYIGYFPMFVKVILGEDALFSTYEPSTQGFDVTVIMYVVTSFALLSNQIGLAAAKPARAPTWELPQGPPQIRTNGDVLITYWSLAGLAGAILAIVSSYLFIVAYGLPVFIASYVSAVQPLPFGTVGVFGAVGILSLFVAGKKGYIQHWKLLFVAVCALFIIFSQLLMGLRQDAMSVLFGLIVLYGVIKGRELGLKLSYLPFLVIGYIFFQAWGVARTALAAGASVSEILTAAFTAVDASGAVTLGTVSPIATTFANTVFMIQNDIIDFALGQSYAEWYLRIPPEALYPDRPRDYGWMFAEYGLQAGGGFFELAEVYMNFGLVGTLVIPGLISYLIARAYYFALSRQTMLSYFLLFSFLAVFLRGTWYQTFAFFKAFLVCLILYFTYIFVIQVLKFCVRGVRSDESFKQLVKPNSSS